MDVSLFVSYSHVDALWMQTFKKHLKGIFRDSCHIWTDQDIPAGSSWQDTLLGSLSQTSAGLVLVSPDYLASPWCRKELDVLAENRASLAGVYWVLLRPCGWKWTQLAELQAAQEPADHALLSIPEGPERETQLLLCCEKIANELRPKFSSGDPVLATIRGILGRSKHASQIRPIETLGRGDFSIVCRAADATGNNVVVKVLTHTPLHRLRKLFLHIAEACRKIGPIPGVVHIQQVFTDGEDDQERVVMINELAASQTLLDFMKIDAEALPAKRHFTIDNIGILLRRIATALHALHQIAPVTFAGEEPHKHLMGPLRPNSIYYDPSTRWPQLSLISVTNLLWQFFEPQTFRRIVGSRYGRYDLPEKQSKEGAHAAHVVGVKADQYFLGLLALELLEGKQLFVVPEGQSPKHPHHIINASGWAKRHQQLADLVRKLTEANPAKRYDSMKDVIDNLHALEESYRALAKYSFSTVVEGQDHGDAFSKDFYVSFFARSPEAKVHFEEAHRRHKALQKHAGRDDPRELLYPDEIQRQKLIEGLIAVLNFRAGGQPSSIYSVAARHSEYSLTKKQMQDFEKSFLDTLEVYVMRSADGGDDAGEIIEAWKQLFVPVTKEMLTHGGGHKAAHDASS